MLASRMLKAFEPYESQTQAKKNVVEAIKSVAQRLGNTPSVCRKCYVHPVVLNKYLNGEMMQEMETAVEREVDRKLHALQDEEHALLRLLEHTVAA